MSEGSTNAARRFVIARGAVRGEHVRLTGAWQQMLARRTYPGPVVSLLGECLAATALLTSTVKMLQDDGRLSVQIQGGSPVSLLVAECRADFSFRAMARLQPNAVFGETNSLADLAQGATFAVTIDPGGDYESYQSLVPIESPSVASALNDYMARSEQIESHFALAANGSVCAGLLVQKVPTLGGHETGDDPDAWNRIRTLAETLTSTELAELPDEQVLYRLFSQEEVRLLPPRKITFVCRCSKERVGSVLKVLGRSEITGLLADRRTIEVDCDFCGLRYTFTAEEAWAALAASA
jgi:molecular chaperone Hsp33